MLSVLAMGKIMVIQGRKITPADIHLIKQLLADHPSWNRTKLSRELCKKWQWLRPDGQQLKDMACRTLLLKLERTGYIELPPARVYQLTVLENARLHWFLIRPKIYAVA
jgi:hypothetical protein